MQLIEYKEALEELNIPLNLVENDIRCLRYEPDSKNFYYYIFMCKFENEEKLLEKYEDINDIIALNFQSYLNKSIEKWNIYLFCFVEKSISNQSRYIVEQDKYSTRKIVLTENYTNKSIEEKIDIVNNKLFNLNLKIDNNSNSMDTIDKIIEDTDPKLLNYISQYTALRMGSKNNNKELKKNILSYLEMKEYE